MLEIGSSRICANPISFPIMAFAPTTAPPKRCPSTSPPTLVLYPTCTATVCKVHDPAQCEPVNPHCSRHMSEGQWCTLTESCWEVRTRVEFTLKLASLSLHNVQTVTDYAMSYLLSGWQNKLRCKMAGFQRESLLWLVFGVRKETGH